MSIQDAGTSKGTGGSNPERPKESEPGRRGGSTQVLTVAVTALAFALSYVLAYLLRFEFSIPDRFYPRVILLSLPAVVGIQLISYYANGVFKILWDYLGVGDLFRIFRASVIATAVITILHLCFLNAATIPRSVIILDGLLSFVLAAGSYVLLRSASEWSRRETYFKVSSEPAFIVGAGDAGESLLREFLRTPMSGARIVGFLDDDASKHGRELRGVPILGGTDRIREFAERHGVRKAFIAMPSADAATMRNMESRMIHAGVAIRILPPREMLSRKAGFVTQLREVPVEDLLRRDAIQLDNEAICGFVKDKIVLVTGAAGSIGSEICRQVLSLSPKKLVVLDCAETPLHNILLELRARPLGDRVVPELADITDRERVHKLFQTHRPNVVFHAAALKHVPLLETHPREAVRTNVGGTRNVAEEARDAGAESFVLISTDKAVNPTSVMGRTKQIAERMVTKLNRESEGTRFMAVRFGNVLGSNGSVLPIFREQIGRGGPITVTHPDMRRYFMTIPEAVQLVMQAAVLGKGGEIFVLDMGEPIRIVDLAEDLIRLSGLVPGVDIKIEFTGVRPGEKLFEELRLDTETVTPTAHPQVFQLRPAELRDLDKGSLNNLGEMCSNGATKEEILAQVNLVLR